MLQVFRESTEILYESIERKDTLNLMKRFEFHMIIFQGK